MKRRARSADHARFFCLLGPITWVYHQISVPRGFDSDPSSAVPLSVRGFSIVTRNGCESWLSLPAVSMAIGKGVGPIGQSGAGIVEGPGSV